MKSTTQGDPAGQAAFLFAAIHSLPDVCDEDLGCLNHPLGEAGVWVGRGGTEAEESQTRPHTAQKNHYCPSPENRIQLIRNSVGSMGVFRGWRKW